MTIYNFAYGSNINFEQMKRRCPGAIPVGPAILSGWKLSFAGKSRIWGGAVATVKQEAGKYTAGVLYRVTDNDLEKLDRYEGYPYVYDRRELKIRILEKTIVTAFVYIHQDQIQGCPTLPYLKTIAKGYRRYGLDLANLITPVWRDYFNREVA